MKFTSPLFTVATAFVLLTAASFETASAVECTVDQILSNGDALLTVTSSSDCAKAMSGTQSQAEICANTKCLDVIKKAVTSFADCTMNGIDPKKTVAETLASCSGTAASAATSTKPSIVTVVATSVLAVLAMRL